MAKATGTFTVTGGSEQTVREAPGEVRLTRVSGAQRFAGSIVGEGSVEWVFCYRPDRSAVFTGLQRIEGSIDGLSGSLILESSGEHDGKRSKGRWRVVAGSGTGELAGIAGEGSFEAPGGPEATYELEYGRAGDEQLRLEQALELDAEDNRRFARAASHAAREAFGEPVGKPMTEPREPA